MPQALVLIIVLFAAVVSTLSLTGARMALGASMVSIAAAALLGRPGIAEAAYWLAAGTLIGAGASSAMRSATRRLQRSRQDW